MFLRVTRHLSSLWKGSDRRPFAHAKNVRPGVELLEDRCLPSGGLSDPSLIVTQPPLALPAVGVPFTDPVFGTTLRRVSNASDQGGFETQIYSQLQAFSSDDQYLLLVGSDGYVVRRVSDLSQVQGLDLSDVNCVRWHPTLPHTLVHFDTNADSDVTVQYTNVDTGVTTDVFTFPSQYTHVYNNQSFDELSEDGRWMAGMVGRDDGQSVIFALDLQNGRLDAQKSLHEVYTTYAQPDPTWGEVEPDWVGVSPLGRYLVVGWKRDGTAGASGVETWDLQTGNFVGRINDAHQHGDLGIMPDGTSEFYMTFDVYGSPADHDRPALALRTLPGSTTIAPASYLQSLDWGNGDHISGRGPNGVALITSGMDTSNGWTAFEGELWLQYTDGSVLRLAHHRSTSSDYWVQPRATMSRDGRYVVFASDWGRNTGGQGDPYIIDLGPTAPPPTTQNHAPVLAALSDQLAREGELLTVRVSATDSDNNRLTYSLDSGSPVGAKIDPITGIFSWTPGEGDGPGTYTVTVRVADDGSPSLADSKSFTINVAEINSPPTLDPINDQEVAAGNPISFMVKAGDPDLPRNLLTFALAAGAPQGARIDSANGVFAWTPAANTPPGQYPITVTVTDNGSPALTPSRTFSITVKAMPTLNIDDVRVIEGNTGRVAATFTVTLAQAASKKVTVSYVTADGTAMAGSDYQAAKGTLVFKPGELQKTITVWVKGDRRYEFDEQFVVHLTGAVGAHLGKELGTGTIVDDDAPPRLIISPGRPSRDAAGNLFVTFTITLSAPSERPVTLTFGASGRTGHGDDHLAFWDTLSFRPGEGRKTVVLILQPRPASSPDFLVVDAFAATTLPPERTRHPGASH